jgi:hypothetical protein
MHVRRTLNIDDRLIEEARRLTGIKERTALIRAGLEALIAGGTQPNFQAAPRRRPKPGAG